MDDNKIERINFLKMDCEGAEGLILSSTPIDYLKKIEKIAMEVHYNSSLNYSQIQSLLESAGFTVNNSKKMFIFGKNKAF